MLMILIASSYSDSISKVKSFFCILSIKKEEPPLTKRGRGDNLVINTPLIKGGEGGSFKELP